MEEVEQEEKHLEGGGCSLCRVWQGPWSIVICGGVGRSSGSLLVIQVGGQCRRQVPTYGGPGPQGREVWV